MTLTCQCDEILHPIHDEPGKLYKARKSTESHQNYLTDEEISKL